MEINGSNSEKFDLNSFKINFQKGYLSGKAITQLIDGGLNGNLTYKDGKWIINERETSLNFSRFQNSFPFWIRRFIHYIRLHISTSYHDQFHQTIEKVALAAESSGLTPKQWIDSLESNAHSIIVEKTVKNLGNKTEDKQEKNKKSTSTGFETQKTKQSDMDLSQACVETIEKLIENQNFKEAFHLAEILCEKEKIKVFSNVLNALLSKEGISSEEIDLALDIAAHTPTELLPKDYNPKDFKLDLRKPFTEPMKDLFYRLVDKEDVENAFKIGSRYLSKREQSEVFPKLIGMLLDGEKPTKEQIDFSVDIAFYIADEKTKKACGLKIIAVAQESDIPKIRQSLDMELKSPFEMITKEAESGNSAGTFLMIDAYKLENDEKIELYILLLKAFFTNRSHLDRKDRKLLKEGIIAKIPEGLRKQLATTIEGDTSFTSSNMKTVNSYLLQ